MKKLLLIGIAIILCHCKQAENKPFVENKVSAGEQADSLYTPISWINSRVTKAEQRLSQTNAGKIVWKAMNAHGGLKNWYTKGPISFRFNYQPLDGGTPRDTYQVVDQWSNTARHYMVDDSTAQYGWDGNKAWIKAKDSLVFSYDVRFWALTPYYFLAQPFVLDGEGVNLEQLPQKTFDGIAVEVIKVTFDDGTGDAPDDYYILYFNAENYQLEVIRYIVSYPGYFKNGGHSPEKLMILETLNTVDGIKLPDGYKTYWLTNDEKAGEFITKIDVSEIDFQPNITEYFFDVPKKAWLVND